MMRSLTRLLAAAIWIACSYLLAGGVQVSVLYLLGGGPSAPRMGYETMPYVLLLSPLLPLLTFDNVVRAPGLRQAMEFAAFCLPFCCFTILSWRRATSSTRKR